MQRQSSNIAARAHDSRAIDIGEVAHLPQAEPHREIGRAKEEGDAVMGFNGSYVLFMFYRAPTRVKRPAADGCGSFSDATPWTL
jgi:hypothetical protein